MKLFSSRIKILVVLIYLLISSHLIVSPTLISAQTISENESIPQIITRRAIEEGLDSQRLLRIAKCESGFNPKALGPGGATGLFQFLPGTFRWAEQLLGKSLNILDAKDNLDAAIIVMKTSGFQHWT